MNRAGVDLAFRFQLLNSKNKPPAMGAGSAPRAKDPDPKSKC